MNLETLTEIADELYGTGDELDAVLDRLGCRAISQEVAAELSARWHFERCINCGLWSDDVQDGWCAECALDEP